MCGICGILELERSEPDRSILLKMRDSMVHRGPDGKGIVTSGPCGLAHRRLSIIDVEHSLQPMSHPETGSWLTYNGEIYNYKELRKELCDQGERFLTQGDTEVVLKILVRDGPEGLLRLNGIFALGYWDSTSRRLLIARDRLGVKPLYYTMSGKRFAFSSEIKALLQIPECRPGVDPESMASYLVYANVHGEKSLFRGILKLPPGSFGVFENGELCVRKYWELPEPDYETPLDFEAAKSKLGTLAEDSVRMQMISDVPVGSLCSGGLDSSYISALCVKEAGETFNTFNASFPQGPPFDESSYAKLVSGHIGSQHHEIMVEAEMVARGLAPLIWYNDEPIHHSSSIAIYYVAREAARHVKVLLSGEGADEMLAGYPRYGLLRLVFLSRKPVVRAALKMVACLIRNTRRREKLLEHLNMDVERSILMNVTTIRYKHLQSTLLPEWREALDEMTFDFEKSLIADGPGDYESLFRRMLRMEQGTFLGTSLDRLDKMTMAASVEGRVPILDHRIVELASRMELPAMLQGREAKRVLKSIARPWVPIEVINRKKWGFGLPIASVLQRQELRDHVELLWEAGSRVQSIFDLTVLKRSWQQLLNGDNSQAELLWRALNLEIWHRLMVDRTMEPPTLPDLGSN